MTSESTSKTDVLIVGAGPVGLTLAGELTRHGIRHRIIDRSPNASDKTKALGVMARTLELFEKLGVADTFLARGHKTYGFNLFSEGKQLAHLNFDELIRSPYPYVLMTPQNITEEILNHFLDKHAGSVERQVELVGFEQRGDQVEATLRHADGGEEKVVCRWLVGCDGAHSTVRHTLGVEFGGTAFAQSFALADIHLEGSLDNNQIYAFLHKGDFIAYFPMDGGRRHRVIIAHKAHTEPSGDVTLQEVQNVIDSCGPHGARASDPTWLARFHINQRKVERYVHGRIILAGDAAHIHSPIGAQGMNTGIQDAFNLGWKLALVVSGRAPETIIESYEAEREAVGRALLQGTEIFTKMALLGKSAGVAVRDHVAPLVMSLSTAQNRLSGAISEIDISYRQSPIVQEEHSGIWKKLFQHTAIAAGDRAPDGSVLSAPHDKPQRLFELLRGTRHVLLYFADPREAASERRESLWQEVQKRMEQDYKDVVEAYRIIPGVPNGIAGDPTDTWLDPQGSLSKAYGVEHGGLVLIRPDGYIAFHSATGSGEGFFDYLGNLFVS